MKIQVSFDTTDLEKAVRIATQIADHVSCIEIGTTMLLQHGVHAVERFRKQFPAHTLLVDAKIIDNAKEIVIMLSQAGADWITVMSGTKKETIHAAGTTAHNLGQKIMIDLLDSSSVGQSALEAQSLGGDALLFHAQYYAQDQEHMLLDEWQMVRGNTNLPVFVSCKYSEELPETIKPDGIILGKSITRADNPLEKLTDFLEKISSDESPST